jgi:hypothetical protein
VAIEPGLLASTMKKTEKNQSALVARPSFPRQLVLFVSLIAFLLQGYVTQTHMHGLGFRAESGVAGFLIKLASGDEAGPGTGKSHDPSKSDPARCLYCQAMGNAGAFVTPTALALLLPVENASIIRLHYLLHSSFETASHDWRGRAPPRI